MTVTGNDCAKAKAYTGIGAMESVLQLYGLVMVILPVHAFVSLRKRLRDERFSRLSALGHYAGSVMSPVVVCAGLLALAMGIEAFTPFDVISDAMIQTYALALVLGVLVVALGTAVFALSMVFARRSQKPGLQSN